MKTATLLLALLFVTGASHACSCMAHEQSVEETYRASSAVFRGTIVDLRREPMRLANGKVAPSSFVEYLTLRVVKSWKGPKVGRLVHLKTNVSPGSCGLNAQTANTKVFFEDTKTARDARITGWLVYGSGSEPYALTMCTRTAPTDGDDRRGLNDINTLDWIANHGAER